MVVSNAAPLIYLAKAKSIEIVFKLLETIQITQGVREEAVDRGKKLGYHDAYIIEEWIKKGKIKIYKLNDEEAKASKEISEKFNIDEGEAESIILALKKKEKTIIMDDKRARETAKLHKLKPIGTLRILIEATKKQIITKEKALEILNKLIDEGFRISIELYKEFTRRIKN